MFKEEIAELGDDLKDWSSCFAWRSPGVQSLSIMQRVTLKGTKKRDWEPCPRGTYLEYEGFILEFIL